MKIRLLLAPAVSAATYTRAAHMFVSAVFAAVCLLVIGADEPGRLIAGLIVLPALVCAAAGLIPAMRHSEGLQARLLLRPAAEEEIAITPAYTWPNRARTSLWLVFRVWSALLAGYLTVQACVLFLWTVHADPLTVFGVRAAGPTWSFVPLAPFALLLVLAVVHASGLLTLNAARALLGPSAAEHLASLELRTEQMLERNRLAAELHDSIGHALTTTVLQAGAARAAGDPEFTARALTAIEETGRRALDDLEHALVLLRQEPVPAAGRPTLARLGELVESSRATGVEVNVRIGGRPGTLPALISREAYRIVQEALTNALRHGGPGPVDVLVDITGEQIALTVSNSPNAAPGATSRTGKGLRGMRERAALLGGEATAGFTDGRWRVHATLPVRLAA